MSLNLYSTWTKNPAVCCAKVRYQHPGWGTEMSWHWSRTPAKSRLHRLHKDQEEGWEGRWSWSWVRAASFNRLCYPAQIQRFSDSACQRLSVATRAAWFSPSEVNVIVTSDEEPLTSKATQPHSQEPDEGAKLLPGCWYSTLVCQTSGRWIFMFCFFKIKEEPRGNDTVMFSLWQQKNQKAESMVFFFHEVSYSGQGPTLQQGDEGLEGSLGWRLLTRLGSHSLSWSCCTARSWYTLWAGPQPVTGRRKTPTQKPTVEIDGALQSRFWWSGSQHFRACSSTF